MIIQKYMCALFVCLAMHAGAYAAQAAQRPDSAPTVPTQMPVEITPRAASDSAVSKKREYQEWRKAVSQVWETRDAVEDKDVIIIGQPLGKEDLVTLSILCCGGDLSVSLEAVTNFLPKDYRQPTDIFEDLETQHVDSQPSKTISPEVSLPKFHVHRPDTSDTTCYVKKPRPIDSKGIVRDGNPSVELNRDKKRIDLYAKLGVRRTRVPSPSSRFPAEVFHQVGEVSKDFSPVPPMEEDALQFGLDL